MGLSYGELAAIKRANAAKKRRANQCAPRTKKARKTPEIEWFPMKWYLNTDTTLHIDWDANEDIARELAERELTSVNLQILTAQTGGGKTSIALSTIGILDRPFIVLVSRAILEGGGWQNTICDYNKHHEKKLNPYMITTYDKFSNILADGKSRVEFKRKFPQDGIIVIDEIHNYKNPTSKRSQKLQLISKYKRLGITATPLTNDMLMDMCSYLVIAGNYTSKNNFVQTYHLDRMKDEYNRIDVYNDDGTVDLRRFPEYPLILEQMAKVIYRPTIHISDSEMPDLITEVIQLPQSEELDADMRSIAKANRDRMYSTPTEMRLIMQERITCDKERVSKCLDLIDQDFVKQPLIYFQHLTTLDVLCIMLESKGIDYQILDGRNPMSKIDRDADTPILVQYRAGREGIEFKNSNTTVFFENQDSFIALEQAKGRNRRRGTTGTVHHYMLVSDNAFDQEVFERIQNKEELNPKTLDEIAEQALPKLSEW